MTNLENQNNPVLLSENGEEFIGVEVKEVWGQDGNDTITSALNATEPGSTLLGNTGDDYIRSRGIGDFVFGGRGNDTVASDNGQAIIYGDIGGDYLFARETRTTLFGGIFVVPGTREESANDGDNIMVSAGGKNILVGGGGKDTILGESGEDTLAGGGGDDSIKGGPGGASFLFGNVGLDVLLSVSTGDPDTMFGGQDNDMVTVDVDSTADNPLLFGGVGDDSLMVAGSDNEVEGAILVGDANPDGSFGGSEGQTEGADYLYAASGKNHQLFGNGGGDRLEVGINIGVGVSLFGGQGGDLLTGGSDGAVAEMKAFGDKGDDTLTFTGSDSAFWGDNPNITTGFGDNVIKVTGSGNTLRGGNDNSTGSDSGNNFIQAIAAAGGSVTNNLLIGGAGNDTIDAGSSGAGDTLDGGPDGDDTYIFTKGQTIVPDTKGLNTYIGVNAAQGDEITVRPNDEIGGEANFFIPGPQRNNVALQAGGVRTEGNDDFIDVDTVTGRVDSGDGNDELRFGAVGGTDPEAAPAVAQAGGGDDKIDVANNVEANGAIDAGSGNDTIDIQGEVSGSVAGNTGDDFIKVDILKAGAAIDGGEGADTIDVDEVFGNITGGGLGKNVFDIGKVFGGASITTGAGDEDIIVGAVGSDAEGVGVALIGGAGKNNLGVSYGTSPSSDAGSSTSAMSLVGGAGDDVLQGTPYSGDTLEGGEGDDFLYGGSAAAAGNDFSAGGSNVAATAVSLGDGDLLSGGAGADNFLFMSLEETGSIDVGSGDFTFAEGGDADSYVINVGTNGAATTGATGSSGKGYLSGAFNVDTITDFNVGEGDRIILNVTAFGDFDLGTDVTVTTFSSQAKGLLFGRFGGNAGIPVGSDGFAAGGTNVVGAGGVFTSSFVVGGSGEADFSVISGSNGGVLDAEGAILFDSSTGGLYLSGTAGAAGSQNAFLVGVLENPTGISATTTFNDIFTVAGVDLQGANQGIELF